MDKTKVPLEELRRIEEWLRAEQERQDVERGKSAGHQNSLRGLAAISLIAAVVGLLSSALPGALQPAEIPKGDIGMIFRGMLIFFSAAVLLMAAHAWFHYIAVKEEYEQADQKQVLEAIVKESEIGNRIQGFTACASLLRNLSLRADNFTLQCRWWSRRKLGAR